MQDSEIYTKTETGREEIRTRAFKLSMAMRAILLMVDGQRAVADLRGIIAGSKAPADALDTLLAQGLIAGTGQPALAAPAPMQPPTVPPSAPPYVPPYAAYTPAYAPPPATLHTPAMAPAANAGAASESSASSQPAAIVQAATPDAASQGELGDPRTRFDRLYTAINEIVRDFLPAHRRYFLQLKIERCNTAEELLEVLHDIRLALAKARGDAFASDVVARLRSAAA